MNLSFHTHKVVREHLYFHGFDVSYTTWSWHGEDVRDTPLPNVDVDVLFEFMDYNYGNSVDMLTMFIRIVLQILRHLNNLWNRLISLCTRDAQISLS